MIPIDPFITVEIVLASDAARPEPRRTFLAHPLTVRQSLRADALIAEHAAEGTSSERRNQIATDLLALTLLGWRGVAGLDGQGLPFDMATLDDVLSTAQKMELLNRSLSLDEGPEDQQKKESPSASPSPAAAG